MNINYGLSVEGNYYYLLGWQQLLRELAELNELPRRGAPVQGLMLTAGRRVLPGVEEQGVEHVLPLQVSNSAANSQVSTVSAMRALHWLRLVSESTIIQVSTVSAMRALLRSRLTI